jgi:hypothetical protein
MRPKKAREPAGRRSFAISEIAARNNLSESYTYAQVVEGKLRARRVGGNGPLRVFEEDETRWLRGEGAAAQADTPDPPPERAQPRKQRQRAEGAATPAA